MKTIPMTLLLACGLCAVCMLRGAAFVFAAPELMAVSRLIILLGVVGVFLERFRWGARIGYGVEGRTFGVQVEHVLRCAMMGGIMTLVCLLLAAPLLQIVFETFFRK